jgi:hypothetical protein
MSTFSFTSDMAIILQDNGFGTIGTNIFIGDDINPHLDTLIKLNRIGTVIPDNPIHSLNLSHPSLNITVIRPAWQYQDCERSAESIKDFMSGLRDYSVGESRYINIIHLEGPTDLGLDGRMRPRYSVQFSCDRTNRI